MTIWDGDKELIYQHLILGSCHGVALVKRGPNDPHVCIKLITEDDGNWAVSKESFSSAWLLDLQDVLADTHNWMDTRCEKDSYGFGYKFKEMKRK